MIYLMKIQRASQLLFILIGIFVMFLLFFYSCVELDEKKIENSKRAKMETSEFDQKDTFSVGSKVIPPMDVRITVENSSPSLARG